MGRIARSAILTGRDPHGPCTLFGVNFYVHSLSRYSSSYAATHAATHHDDMLLH